MPTNIRYAVARDPVTQPVSAAFDKIQRQWWQLKREEFGDWDTRQLFQKKSTALALLWKLRDAYDAPRNRYTLFTVTRVTKEAEKIIP